MSNESTVLVRNTERTPKHRPATQIVVFSHCNHLSAQLPIEPIFEQLVEGDIRAQATQCSKNIQAVVESINHVMSNTIGMIIFVKDMWDAVMVEGVYTTFFTHYYPAKTVVAVVDLPLGASVQMEAFVLNGEGTIPNTPQVGDSTKLANQTVQAPIDALAS